MIQDQITWDTLFRGVIPLASASIFFVVLVYFYLARHRIGKAFPFYAIFIVCFMCFLCGPLINMLPIDIAKRWYDMLRNILLFSVGIPSLSLALLYQAKVSISSIVRFSPYIVGVLWSLFFIMAPPLISYNPIEFPWLLSIEGISPHHIYLSQAAVVVGLLVVPCLFVLNKPIKTFVRINVYGVLSLCVVMCVGNIFLLWEVYYAGASFTALIWGVAVFREIQITHRMLKLYGEHQGSLAKAQFSSPSSKTFTDYYPDKLNESYPYKERESLVEAVSTLSIGLVESRMTTLQLALKGFSQNNVDIYRVRSKEVVFMLFDSIIYKSQNAKILLGVLEQKGKDLDVATTFESIDNILLVEANFLANREPEKISRDGDSALVDRVKEYLLGHYDQNIGINDVIEEIGASRSHIMKTFKQVTSTTINQYLIEVRMKKSKNLLLSQSITQTAFDVGFNNSAYFSTVFKKETQMTPKQYQQQAKSTI